MNNASTVRAEQLIGAIRDGSLVSGRENSRSATILLGDGLAKNPDFVKKVIEAETHRFLKAETAPKLFETLSNTSVDLVILPGVGTGLVGLDCCRRIKADRVKMLPGSFEFSQQIEGISLNELEVGVAVQFRVPLRLSQ